MITFLHPQWFWLCTSIVILIAIHLLNRKESKSLLVGNISLIKQASKTSFFNFAWAEWLLFFLRALFILLVALLLSQPSWINSRRANGWLLIYPNQYGVIIKNYSYKLDSLQKKGFEIHLLTKEFPYYSWKDLYQKQAPVSLQKQDSFENANTWQYIGLLDKKLPKGFPLVVFCSNQLSEFSFERPKVERSIQILPILKADSSEWLVNAWKMPNGKYRSITAKSKTNGTIYKSGILTVKQLKNKKPFLPLNHPLNILIFRKGMQQDAFYLSAALKAISIQDSIPIDFSVLSIGDTVKNKNSSKVNWIFWLTDLPLPKKFIGSFKDGSNQTSIFKYAKTGLSGNDKLEFNNKLELNDKLGVNNESGQISYTFFGRFSPVNSELVWKGEFPEFIRDLIFNTSSQMLIPEAMDKRMIDSRQMQVEDLKIESGPVSKYRDENQASFPSLNIIIWFLTLGVLLLERILSSKETKHIAEHDD